MDYSFYALVAICIFLLILTFYLAVRRRRQASRRHALNRSHEPIVNQNHHTSAAAVIDLAMPPRERDHQRPLLSEYNIPPPVAAYKPEDPPHLPPPSYQDYTKDVRLLQSPSQQQQQQSYQQENQPHR